MSVVRRFAVRGLDAAARRRGRMVIGAVDETGQEKAGEATAGVKRRTAVHERPGARRSGRQARKMHGAHESLVDSQHGSKIRQRSRRSPRSCVDYRAKPPPAMKEPSSVGNLVDALEHAYRTTGFEVAVGVRRDVPPSNQEPAVVDAPDVLNRVKG
jgi:hypothetical protein